MHYWWLAIRPRTLPASISPVLLGSALAASESTLNLPLAGLALTCALLLQISVNLANDLFDGLSGVDSADRLGPARMVQSGFISVRAMGLALLVSTLLAVVTGLTLAWHSDWQLLYVGVFCVLAVFAYSAGPWPLASLGLGELAVLVFFGWVAVMGAYFLQTDHLSWQAWWYGCAAGLLNVAVMLVNNLRDIPTDRRANKTTLAVRLGDARTRRLYQALLLLAMLSHMLASPDEALLMLVPILLCAYPIWQRWQDIQHRQGRQLNPLLGSTAQLVLLYCVSTSAVLWLG